MLQTLHSHHLNTITFNIHDHLGQEAQDCHYVSCALYNGLASLLLTWSMNSSGGGIGGLAFAVALSKSGVDFDVDIYESAQCFSEVGAGIGVWPRVTRTLQDLGLEEDLKKASSTWDGGCTSLTPLYLVILLLDCFIRGKFDVLQI